MNAFDLQIELTVDAVDGEAYSRYADVEPVHRPVEGFLDIRGQPVELDGALDQPPEAEPDDEDQRCGERAEPHQEAVRAPPHSHRRRTAALG